LPQLELPPPDRIQGFELGPGVDHKDISVVSLYGKLCCFVFYVDNNSLGFITVYSISKTSVVERICTLSFNQVVSNSINISVYDNLLIAHNAKVKKSFVFDLKLNNNNNKNNYNYKNSNNLLNNINEASPINKKKSKIKINQIDALCSPSCIYFEDELIDVNINIDNSNNNNNYINNIDNNNNNNNNFNNGNDSIDKKINEISNDNNKDDKDKKDFIENKNILFNNNNNQDIKHIKNFETLSFSINNLNKNYLKNYTHQNDNNNNKNTNNNKTSIVEKQKKYKYNYIKKTVPVAATEIYENFENFKFFYPHWIWDKNNKILWKLKVNFEAIKNSMHNHKEVITFLCRRGL
jgi:hypothetical protein